METKPKLDVPIGVGTQERMQRAMTLVGDAMREARLPSARDEMAILVLSMVVVVDKLRDEVASTWPENARLLSRGHVINKACELLRRKLQRNLKR